MLLLVVCVPVEACAEMAARYFAPGRKRRDSYDHGTPKWSLVGIGDPPVLARAFREGLDHRSRKVRDKEDSGCGSAKNIGSTLPLFGVLLLRLEINELPGEDKQCLFCGLGPGDVCC